MTDERERLGRVVQGLLPFLPGGHRTGEFGAGQFEGEHAAHVLRCLEQPRDDDRGEVPQRRGAQFQLAEPGLGAGRAAAQDGAVALDRGVQPACQFQQGLAFGRACPVKGEQGLHVLYRWQQVAVLQLGDLGLGHACPARGFHAGQARALAQVPQRGGQPLAISEITFRVHSPPDSRAADDHAWLLSQFSRQNCG